MAIYCLMIIIVNFYCSEQESYVATGHVFSSFPFPISVSDFWVQIPFPAFPSAPLKCKPLLAHIIIW